MHGRGIGRHAEAWGACAGGGSGLCVAGGSDNGASRCDGGERRIRVEAEELALLGCEGDVGEFVGGTEELVERFDDVVDKDYADGPDGVEGIEVDGRV